MTRMTIGGQLTESAPLRSIFRQPLEQFVPGSVEIWSVHHQFTPSCPDGRSRVLGDDLLDFFQIALVGYGVSLGRQVLGIGGPHRVEVQHDETVESTLLGHFLHLGDRVVQFLLGGRAGVDPDGDERTLADGAQGVAPLVVVLGVVDLVHSAFQVGIRSVCPVRSGSGIRLFCTTYAGA